MKNRSVLPVWLGAAALTLVAVCARVFMIQPPDVAHQCDRGHGPWWCVVRSLVIETYAWYGLGYLALLFCLLVLLVRRAWISMAALYIGTLALVLYCYEPGALAVTLGAITLARYQATKTAYPSL